jgi:hypothetical protein
MADILAGRVVRPPAHIPAGLAAADTEVVVEAVVEEAATAAEAMAADTAVDTTDRQLLERAHQIDPALMPDRMTGNPYMQTHP